ncbi:MAG: recombinase family protein [Vicinamibacterales bacterium]
MQTANLSLPTQLRACEEYCRRQGYEILERFHEEGESAKSTDRSQLQNLLTFCRRNKGRVHFVVGFNLTRFARDKYDHFALRSLPQSLGISLRSASIFEMPLRERAAGAGFQVPLEADGAALIGELNDHVTLPWPR